MPINILNGGDDLNNYFDPRSNSVNLSQAVYHTDSIAAMCIACHEVGHAIQHATNYAPVRIRNGIVPLVNLTFLAANHAGIDFLHLQPVRLPAV